MARKRDAAYGAPQEEKEVVVSIDSRLLVGVGLVLLCVVALGAGFWYAQRGAPAAVSSAPPEVTLAQANAQATADMAAQKSALGLPDSAVVVEPMKRTTELAAPVATAGPGGGAEGAGAAVPGQGTAAPAQDPAGDLPPAAATMASEHGGQIIPFEEGRPNASDWDWDVTVNYEDPNVTKPEYEPARTEEVKQPLQGPRLGISELNFLNSFAYGKVPMDMPAAHDFTMTNVGDADLVVGRIYTGCGCTATRFGEVYLDNAGFLPKPMTLRPGESQVFTIEFDPRAEGKPGAQSKYIQIFSNDPTKTQFDTADPNSRETRFRIVVQPAYEVKAPEGAKAFKVAKFGGDSVAPTPDKR